MLSYPLVAKKDDGATIIPALPNITTTLYWEKQAKMLAVIFDVKNSPDVAFYPHFSAKNPEEILALRQDFLWENHCYELFLAFSNEKNSPYVEINFSPSGEFNLYHFDSYRTPQQMPPRRFNVRGNERQSLLNVYQVNGKYLPVFWQDSLIKQLNLSQLIAKNYPLQAENHRLVVLLDMQKLAEILQVTHSKVMECIWLNPCAVFKGKQELAYFAYQHANPPDFHTKGCWLEVRA